MYLFNLNVVRFYCSDFYWGLGIGDWGLGPIPNPQSPTYYIIKLKLNFLVKYIYLLIIIS